MGMKLPSITARCLAEGIGTFILVFFGCGSVHAAVLTGALTGLWQVAIVWGLGITLAIYVVGGISGAHINPAITLALAVWDRFSWRMVPAYIASQLVGAILAAATLFLLYHPMLKEMNDVTATCYGEYYDKISAPAAFAAEVLGTLILALAVFALTDERNNAAPLARLAPLFIGLTVAILISVLAPLTQACFNPARDFGPRLFAYFAGWGDVAIPGRNGSGFFTVYILAPVLGAVAGGGLYVHLLRPNFPEIDDKRNDPS